MGKICQVNYTDIHGESHGYEGIKAADQECGNNEL